MKTKTIAALKKKKKKKKMENKGATQALCSDSRCPAQLRDEILLQSTRWMGFRLAIFP
jgi:hypothetical protein